MNKAVLARLSRLEAAALPPARGIPMFAWGMSEDEIKAEQAEMVRMGVASPGVTPSE